MWSCGGDSGAFCTECVVLEGVREQLEDPGGGVRGDTALQREDTREGVEKHHVVGGDVEKEKKRNGPTNAGTCTFVVWAHRGANSKALPPKNIIRTSFFGVRSTSFHIYSPLLTFFLCFIV